MIKVLAILLFLFSVASVSALTIKSPEEVLIPGQKASYQASVLGLEATQNVYLTVDASDSAYRFTFRTKIDPSIQDVVHFQESQLESQVRKKDLSSLRFEERMIEAAKTRHLIINFNPELGTATYEKDSTVILADSQTTVNFTGTVCKILPATRDFLSLIVYLRLIDSVAVGDTFFVASLAENKRRAYLLPVVVLREEVVTVPAGKFDCWVLKCCFRRTGLFGTGDIVVWIAKDNARQIVQIVQYHKLLIKWVSLVYKLKAIE